MKYPHVMRWVVAVLTGLALPLLPSRATCAEEGTAPDALAPGSWSVQFSVQPNFTLGTYSGSTLSLKKHLGNGNALRMGLSVNLLNRGDDFGSVTSDTTTLFTDSFTLDDNGWSVGANALYLWYIHDSAPIHAYWGAGPSVSVIHGRDESQQTQAITPPGGTPVSTTYARDQETDGWSAELAAALGVEWLVARRVGLFAEYQTSFGYAHTESEETLSRTTTSSSTDWTTVTEREQNRWDFSGSGGRLGVSVYF